MGTILNSTDTDMPVNCPVGQFPDTPAEPLVKKGNRIIKKGNRITPPSANGSEESSKNLPGDAENCGLLDSSTQVDQRQGEFPKPFHGRLYTAIPERLEAPQSMPGNAPARAPISRGDLWERVIGRSVGRDTWIDGQARARRLREQSDDIVRRLENGNIGGRQSRNATTLVGLCTGRADRVSEYRNSNLIPVQQTKNVHDMLRHVRHYVDSTSKKQLRMMVISNGWVPLDQYRETHKGFARRLSRLIADPKFRDAGLEAVFFNIENTINRSPDGVPMLNQHAHLLIRSRRRLGGPRWAELMAWVRGRFPKGYAHDSALTNPAECVKYVFKWGEVEGLTDPELADLFHQTYRLKFFHPVGAIREYRNELKRRGLKLVQVPGHDDRWVWRTISKRCPGTASEESEGDHEADPGQSAMTLLMMQEGDPAKRKGPDANQIIGITMPMPKFSPRFEPCLIVQNYNGDFGDLLTLPHVRALANKARAIWDGREECKPPSSIKDTTTTTVPATGASWEGLLGVPPPSIDDVMARWNNIY